MENVSGYSMRDYFRHQGPVGGDNHWCSQPVQNDEGRKTQGPRHQRQRLSHQGNLMSIK